jgi:TRAP transporter 4TM/12TM fusion protein
MREFKGFAGKLIFIIAVLTALYHLLYISDVFNIALYLYGAHRALSMGLLLALCFLLVPATNTLAQKRLPWYDVILVFAALSATLYIFIFYQQVTTSYTVPSVGEKTLAGIAFLVSLEAVRRTVGWSVTILGAFFILYPLLGSFFPGFLFTKSYSFTRIVGQFYLSTVGMFGWIADIFVTVVATFLIFAQFLRATGAGDFFINLGLSVVGYFRGGSAKAAVVASSIFGTISGLAVANVVTSGTITIPLMKRSGYKSEFAAAVEAVASTGGQIMPPVMGAAAFIMADFLGVSYWAVVIAAVIPAIIYYIALFVMVDLEAVKAKHAGMARAEIPPFWKTLRSGWPNFIPVVALVYFLGVLNYEIDTSALYALIVLILVSSFKKETRLSLSKALTALAEGVYSLVTIGPVALVLGIIVGSVTLTGLGNTLSSQLTAITGGSLISLLIFAALGSFILGMGLPTVACYVLMAILVAPALVSMGVLPIAAHLFVFYWGMLSMITPPVALAAYVAAPIADANPTKVGLIAVRLGAVAFVVAF